MPQMVRDVRGVPLWLWREYLVEMGGEAQNDWHVVGEGWEVHLTQMPDFQLGSLRVGEVRIELLGEEPVFSAFKAQLERKLVRGGG